MKKIDPNKFIDEIIGIKEEDSPDDNEAEDIVDVEFSEIVEAPEHPIMDPPDDDDEDDTRLAVSEDPKKLEADFVSVRNNIRNIINNSNIAIENLTSLAETSQSARAFEVLANLMKITVESNKDLIDLHSVNLKIKKQKEEIGQGTLSKSGDTIIDKAIIVGTTKDLQDIINREFEKETKPIE